MQRSDRHGQLRSQIRQPPFILFQMLVVSDTARQCAAAYAAIAQQATQHRMGKMPCTFRWMEAFCVEDRCDL